MSDVIRMKGHQRNVAFRYQQGDMVAALRLALESPEAAGDLEEALAGLLFGSGDLEHDAAAAREELFEILEAASS